MHSKNNKPYIMGIDPGLSGAFAVIDPNMNQVVSLWDTPTLLKNNHSQKKMIDLNTLAIQVQAVINDCQLCVIEDVHSMPGQGVASMFTFGQVCGIVTGMIAAHLVGIYFVSPIACKSSMGLSHNKDESRIEATKRYPFSKHLWERKKDDGRAEAVLMADFGKRFY